MSAGRMLAGPSGSGGRAGPPGLIRAPVCPAVKDRYRDGDDSSSESDSSDERVVSFRTRPSRPRHILLPELLGAVPGPTPHSTRDRQRPPLPGGGHVPPLASRCVWCDHSAWKWSVSATWGTSFSPHQPHLLASLCSQSLLPALCPVCFLPQVHPCPPGSTVPLPDALLCLRSCTYVWPSLPSLPV